MPEPPERWLAESRLRMHSLHAQNSKQTHGRGVGSGQRCVDLSVLGQRKPHWGDQQLSRTQHGQRGLVPQPRPHNHPVPKGLQCSLAEGPLHKGQGREDGLSQMRLERLSLRGRKQQQRSSSRKPPWGCALSEIRPLQPGKATQKATWFFPFQHWLVYSGRQTLLES